MPDSVAEESSLPVRLDDALEDCEAPSTPYFDHARDAWVLSRYDDVSAALRNAGLVVFGTSLGAMGDRHAAERMAGAASTFPEQLARWRVYGEERAIALLRTLPARATVDLMARVVRPWALEFACRVCDVPSAAAPACASLAEAVFLAAATATDGAPRASGTTAAQALAQVLAARPDGGAEGSVLDVQSFVALSQTLACLLSGGWRLLLQHGAVMQQLRARPELIPTAVNEMLRAASPSRALFRSAATDTTVGGARIRRSERVILLLSVANRDPAYFPAPHVIDLTRTTPAHLAFGTGAHRCIGASLVRAAAAAITAAVLGETRELALAEANPLMLSWTGGFAIRAPASLFVVLQR